MEADKRKLSASITVEASIGLTAFLFFFSSFLYLFLVLILQLKIQTALEEAADLQVAYASVRGISSESKLSFIECTLDSAFVQEYVTASVGNDFLEASFVKGKGSGLKFTNCRFMEKGETIALCVHYTVEIPFLSLVKIKLIQNARRRVWCGFDSSVLTKENGKEDDPIVYITEKGSVYHLTNVCTYLHMDADAIDYESLMGMRTSSGGKYYPCNVCKPDASGIVYVTRYGTKYHASEKCSAIERNAIAVHLSEVSDRRVCSKCESKKGE